MANEKDTNLTDLAKDFANLKSLAEKVQKSIKEQISQNGITPEVMSKSWQQLPIAPASRSPKSWFQNPLELQHSLGYKDRKFALTYEVIKKMVAEMPLINAIINVRCSQIAAFAQPYRHTKSIGFVIKHKDPDHSTSSAELAFIKELEQFIMNCGVEEKNPYSLIDRDDFNTFTRKFIRDSLTLDSATYEIVNDTNGYPYEFMVVPADTIRIASDDRVPINQGLFSREGFVPENGGRFGRMYNEGGNQYGTHSDDGQKIKFVQILNGVVENTYSSDELAFCIRNPRSDLNVCGYGMAEVECLISIITGFLYATQFNLKYFSQGTLAKGILNFKGDNWNTDTLNAFKQEWVAMVQGIGNAHSLPVMQSEGAEYIDLLRTNNEMQFQQWIEFLTKLICAIYMIDPAEVGFDLGGGASNTPLFESAEEWKLKASKDKGLKPLLNFYARSLNKNIIDKIDNNFYLEFIGLDELGEKDKHEMLLSQIGSYLTLNEARRSLDLPDLPNGNYVLNPIYVQIMSEAKQMELQEKQMAQESQMPMDGEEEAPIDEEEAPLEEEEPEVDYSPRYAGTFGN